jgi:hypothetical protein
MGSTEIYMLCRAVRTRFMSAQHSMRMIPHSSGDLLKDSCLISHRRESSLMFLAGSCRGRAY